LLNGVNTYTGLTSVSSGTLGGNGTIAGSVTLAAAGSLAPGGSISAGTLSIGGGLDISSQANNGSGKLKFKLGSNTETSDQIAVTGALVTGGRLGFSDFVFTYLGGGPKNGTYTLITTGANPSGTLAGTGLSGPIGDGGTGTLAISGNNIVLNVSGLSSGSAYDAWMAANAPASNPDDDSDGDGVSNAVEFVLGGTSSAKDLEKLPVPATDGSDMTFTFERDQSSIDPKTSLSIEVSNDLVTWDTAPSPYTVPDVAVANNPGVTVVKNTPPDFDTVTLRLPQSETKKFARLRVVITP
jgi:hypothetical protein